MVCRYTITIDQHGNPEPYYATLPAIARGALEQLKAISPDSQFSGTLRLDTPKPPTDTTSKTTMVWKWTRRLLHGY